MPTNNRFLLPLVIILGLVSLATVGFLVWRGVQKPQNAVPSRAAGTTSDPTKCQGNTNPSPKCFKCESGTNKNNPVGILDFSCFRNFYGKTVGTNDTNQVLTDTVIKKVQLIIFNPVINTTTGQKLIDYKNWNDPDRLTAQFISDVKTLSGGYLTYQVTDKTTVDGFNEKADGFNYTANSYISCLNSPSTCHQPDAVNYVKILDTYQSCEKRNSGQIDEVWLWGGPYFGYWEAVMTGTNALFTNAPPFTDPRCQKQLNIMGFNYERGVAEMLEDLGHRTEGALSTVFGEDPRFNPGNYSTPWGKFATSDQISPGNAGCGWMHFAPNSQSNYDWSNQRSVNSSCDDWLNYPNLTDRKTLINCNSWRCDDYNYKKWWFNHLPKTSGKTNGKLNNWWKYVADYENAITQ